MKKQNTEPIGIVIRQFLQENGLEKPFLEHKVAEALPRLMGKMIAKYTGTLNVKNGTLYVQITSAALRQELFLARDILIKKLNDEVGAEIITDIRLLA